MKISINIFTYLFYILLILSGYINYLVVFLGIMLVHELGHILFIYLFKYKINKINIYPSGAIISTNININIHPVKQLIISLGGILFQLLLFLIIRDNFTYTYQIFYKLNIMLIIFNLVPIYPLDGYKIFLSLIEYIYKYRIIIWLTYIVSVVSLIIFFYFTKNLYIFIFLYIVNIKNIMNYKFYYQKFLLERHLYKIKYKKEKIVNSIRDFYKCRSNYIFSNKTLISEDNIYQYLYKSIDKNQ